MSKWYKVEKDDIEISRDGKEIEICAGSNDEGNIYVEVDIKDIIDLLIYDNIEVLT